MKYKKLSAIIIALILVISLTIPGVMGMASYAEIVNYLNQINLDFSLLAANEQSVSGNEVLEFTSNGDGTCYVSELTDESISEIIIPDKSPMGDIVTEIGDSAFYRCRYLTSVVIPDSVTSIGKYAFWLCDSLKSIVIPNSVTSIGNYAFDKCDNMTVVYVDSTEIAKQLTSSSACGKLIENAKAVLIKADINEIPEYVLSEFPYTDTVEYNGVTYTSHQICASSGKCGDDLTWIFDITTGELTITGTGDMEDYYSYPRSPWYIYNTDIVTVTIGDSVTSIGNRAFEDCISLKNIVLPNSLTSIGENAFYGCSSLTSIVIPDGVTSIESGAFRACNDLEKIAVSENNSYFNVSGNCLIEAATGTLIWGCKNSVIPSDGSVKSIGEYAFSGCSLTSIDIPDSVTSICTGAFYECKSLTSIVIPDGVKSIGDFAFYWCSNMTSVVIPDSVTTIGDYAFYLCSDMTDVIIPDSVTSVGNSAFAICSSLTSIAIPNSVMSIGDFAFSSCDNITVVYIDSPEIAKQLTSSSACGKLIENAKAVLINADITEIPEYVLSEFSYMDTVEYNGATYTSHKKYASSGMCGDDITWTLDITTGELTIMGTGEMENYKPFSAPWSTYKKVIITVTISDGVTGIGDCAFDDCTSITSIVIPDSVTTIGERAFRYCSSLTDIVIPNNVTSIGESAFWDCRSLTSIVIPDGVTRIEDYAFGACSSLTSIVIPNRVTSIGNYAFDGCRNLTSIMIPNWVTSIGDCAFQQCSSLTSIVLPDSVTSIGSDAFWDCSNLTSIIIPYGVTRIEGGTFDGCVNLKSIEIPNSVTSIGTRAFWTCTSLTDILIPDSVTSIEFGAFEDCSSLICAVILNPECHMDDDGIFYGGNPIIYGYPNSTAQQLAEDEYLQFVPIIDLTLEDGSVNENYNLYYQTKSGENGTDYRIISVAKEEYIKSLNSATIHATFGVKTLDLNVTTMFEFIDATDDEGNPVLYRAGKGLVITGCIVTGVPTGSEIDASSVKFITE